MCSGTSIGEWEDGEGEFVHNVCTNLAQPPPWTLPYEGRRAASKEERVMRQLAAEHEWDGTLVEGLWQRLRGFAHPCHNFVLRSSEFCEMLRCEGIDSVSMRQALYMLFCAHLRVSADEGVGALCLCKLIELALRDSVLSHRIAAHCFNALPRELEAWPTRLSHASLDSTLERLTEMQAKQRRGAPRSKRRSRAHATQIVPLQLERILAVKEVLLAAAVDVVDVEGFTTLFLGPRSGKLVPHFVKQIFEVCYQCLSTTSSTTALPALSSRWLSTVAPVAYSRTAPMDADALLLQEYEQGHTGRSKRCK